MPLSAPLVSLCVPTRNRAAALNESLQTICGQDYSPLEILISDNHSDDDTERVVRDWMARDPRIRYVRHERNIGLHGNHNFCFDEARGDFICICHDHDRRDRHIVSEYVSFLADHPRVGIVCSDWDLIDDADRQIGVRSHEAPPVTAGLDYIARTMRAGRSSVSIPGAMVRRDALGSSRFVLDAPIGFGDFPVWFRVAETWDVGHIPKRLWSWRQNQESHSARAIEAIAHDYDVNLNGYCDEHLQRWPGHRAQVEQWRASIRHYLFWALCYEVALHFRDRGANRPTEDGRSLFEIMDYRLTPEQFESALSQMSRYTSGVSERLASTGLRTLIAIRLTRPLGWASRHHAALRAVLGLK